MSKHVAIRQKQSDARNTVNVESRQRNPGADEGDHTVFLSKTHGTLLLPMLSLHCRISPDGSSCR
jgi:hypothetical protein